MFVQLACLICVMLNVAQAATDPSSRQVFLDCHNYMRSQLALGKYKNQPPAADMTVMDYDSQLEERAIAWNDQCTVGHDSGDHRLVQNYKDIFGAIGQNWAGASGGSVLKYSCEGWWNEYVDYDYATNSKLDPNKMIGHYTQMAWAKSTLVGCAVTNKCVNAYIQHSVCNYAAAGNYNGEKPYKQGPACSQCPDGYTMCMGGSLCARPDQCSQSGISCTCSLTCQNGGVRDSQSCSCKCATDYFGDSCQNKCEDTNKYCLPPYVIDCANSYWKNTCKKKCNNCVNAKPFVTQSSEGVRIRINADWLNTNVGGAIQTTQRPIQNTAGSFQTTRRPMENTAGSFQTTRRPIEITAGSFQTTRRPIENTAGSFQTTRRPIENTAGSFQTTRRPIENTARSFQTTRRPIENTAGSFQTTRRPIENTAGSFQTTRRPIENTAGSFQTTTSGNEECVDYQTAWCDVRKSQCNRCPIVDVLCPQTCNTCARALQCRDNSNQCQQAQQYGCQSFFKQLCRETCSDCGQKLNQNQNTNAAPLATLDPNTPQDCLNYDAKYCADRAQTCWCPIVKALCPQTCNSCAFRRECVDRYGSNCVEGKCDGYWKYLCRKTCKQC